MNDALLSRIIYWVFAISCITGTLVTTALAAPSKVNPADTFEITDAAGRAVRCARLKSGIQPGTLKGKKFTPLSDALAKLRSKMKLTSSPKTLKKLRTALAERKRYIKDVTGRCRNTEKRETSLEPLDRPMTREDVRSFLEKAGFGLGPSDEYLVPIAEEQGIDAFVDAFMSSRAEPIDLIARVLDRRDQQLGSSTNQSPSGQRQALLDLWTNTNNPYREKLALFLLSVWTVSGDVIADETFRGAFWDYYEKLRQSAASDTSLPDLGVQLTRDPLMLLYLNNETNTKASPNENFARELMELFSLGPVDLEGTPNYTETTLDGNGDIAIAARMLTGWKIKLNYVTNQIDAQYDNSRHAPGPHLMFPGKSWSFIGETDEDLVRGIFAHHPGVKYFYAREILKEYLTPAPPRALVDAFADEIAAANYRLRPAMRALFRSKAYFDSGYRDSTPKSSVEYAVELIRTLGLSRAFSPNEADNLLTQMGMQVNLAPSVFWFSTSSYTSPSVLLGRSNLVAFVISDSTSQRKPDPDWTPQEVLPGGVVSASTVLEHVATRLGIHTLTDQQRSSLMHYMNTVRQYDQTYQNVPYDNQDASMRQKKGMGLYYVLAALPEFQLK